MKSLWLFLLLITVFSSCKKENNNVQNFVEFDLDGVHYSYTPDTTILYRDTLITGLRKSMLMSGYTDPANFWILGIIEDISGTSSDCILTGAYPSQSYYPGCSDTIYNNCRFFTFKFSKADTIWSNSRVVDSLTKFNLVSCGESPNTINGTFSGTVQTRDSSSVKQLTNGIIRGVTFTRQ